MGSSLPLRHVDRESMTDQWCRGNCRWSCRCDARWVGQCVSRGQPSAWMSLLHCRPLQLPCAGHTYLTPQHSYKSRSHKGYKGIACLFRCCFLDISHEHKQQHKQNACLMLSLRVGLQVKWVGCMSHVVSERWAAGNVGRLHGSC